ncbi:MAG TPA: methyl-accepting chemotaxis protein [Ktedonobacterales bacterium]|nr:methyl-accepting chemotaxis protein [Ktedonobacterales bacterium]
MDPNSRTGASVSGQLNLLVSIATLAPAIAILGLGFYSIGQISNASGGSGSDTLLWAVTLTVAVLTVLAVAFAALRMRGLMRGRALEIAEVCRQASTGQRDVRAPVVGDDEYSLLAASVNALLDGVPAPGVSKGLSEAPDAARLQAQIEKLLQEVSAVGDGDLRVQAEVTPDTLGVLADSFNYMIEELAKVVGRVQATAVQVTTATRRLLDRSAEVSQASEAQAEQITRTSEAVARLADFVQLSANNALQAADAARGALKSSQAGQDAVVQTIDGMARIRDNVQETAKKIKRLGERSQEVGEIVRLIEDIADQTNLLALNAAIQSAMAGEHGRGFAVVAEEIRELAVRVTEATKKIANIVKAIQGDTYDAVVAMEDSTQQVVKGSQLADEAGHSLQSIYSAVENQAQMIQGIAHAATERKQTAEAVAYAMNQIADITRQTSAATMDAANNMSYLAELAEQLRGSVATFRLPDKISEEVGLQPASYQPAQLEMGPELGVQEWINGPQPLPALPAGPTAPVAPVGPLPMGGYGNGDGYNGYGEYPGYDGYDSYNGATYDYTVPGAPNGMNGQNVIGSGYANGMNAGANNGQRGYGAWPDDDPFPPSDHMAGPSY